MTFISRKLALAVGLAFATWQPAALAQSSPASLFDGYVAAGLPQGFALPRPADDERGEGIDQVVVEEKLDTDVVFPDGSHATTYIGKANGMEATFTRIGDDLSVSVYDERLESAVSTGQIRRSVASRMNDAISPPPSTDRHVSPRIAEAAAPRELQFWIFLHDQSGETNYAKFHNWYIAWWVRDMERTVKPGIPVKVVIKDRIPGVTDFDFHPGTSGDALLAFENIANTYLYDAGNMPSGLTKVMLFIGNRPANWNGSYGKAIQRGNVAMASGAGPRHGVAHEFGHTLNALHEHAETRFPCVTNMSDFTPGLYSCRIYSGLNDVQIREHVREERERHADD